MGNFSEIALAERPPRNHNVDGAGPPFSMSVAPATGNGAGRRPRSLGNPHSLPGLVTHPRTCGQLSRQFLSRVHPKNPPGPTETPAKERATRESTA